MLVTFVALQTNGNETREKKLFTENYALIYKGKKIKANGQKFQIDRLEWTNQQAGEIKAICLESVHPYKKQNQ